MEVLKPLPFADLQTKPPLAGSIRLSEDMQQTLSLLSCFDGGQRRLLRCTESGILQTVNPLLQGFLNILADEINYVWQGDNVKCTEVVVRAHPTNAGDVWLNVYEAAAVDTGWILQANEYLPITITNLEHLHLLITANTEKAILEYTL